MRTRKTDCHKQVEPSGLWSYYHINVDFDEVDYRNIYWMMRDKSHWSQMPDEEIKNMVTSLKEFAEISYYMYVCLHNKLNTSFTDPLAYGLI